LFVQGTTTQVDSTTINLADNVLQLNAAGTSDGGLVVRDATGVSTTSGSLLWDVTNDYWKAGKLGSESPILLAGGSGVVSGSSQITLQSTTGYSTLATWSSSVDVHIANVNAVTASLLGSVSNLNQTTASLNTSIANLNTTTASLNTSVTNINSFSSSVLTQLSAIGTETASLETRFSTLATYTGSIETRLTTIQSLTSSNAVRLTNLETTSASVNISISNLNAATSSYETKGRSIVSGSSQLTGSYDTRYVLSGSITQTTWDNIANKPSGIVSGSSQVDITATTGFTTFSGSIASQFATIDGGTY